MPAQQKAGAVSSYHKNILCMKLNFKTIALSILFLLGVSTKSISQDITSHSSRNYSKLAIASWLIGAWQNNSNQEISTEIWKRNNDSTLSAISYTTKGSDTIFFETIILQQNGKDLFYIPTVKNQNNNKPVSFTLTTYTPNQVIFENAAHDFPQKISYTMVSNDSLLAEISGIINGKINSEKFPMTRVK